VTRLSRGKKLLAAALAVASLRLAVLAGAGTFLREQLDDLLNGGLVTASVELELGTRNKAASGGATPSPAAREDASPSPIPATAPPADQTETGEILETTIYSGLAIKNNTDYELDAAALLREGLALTLSTEGPQILIQHTHSSEAYTPDGQDVYVPTDADRTEDTRYNVVRVGDELTAALESYGLRVVHDRTIYDYPSYTGSYSRSAAAAQKLLDEYPTISMVIDLHRDALGTDDVTYKTVAELSGETSSQVMLLCCSDNSGLEHPNWRENLKLALYLQEAMVSLYPTLARPVAVVKERYNQHLTTGSLLLEVGSSGNTLQEALCAVRLFADAAGPALRKLVATD
jgi:stage II sporulation protein P